MTEIFQKCLVMFLGALIVGLTGCTIYTPHWRASFLTPSPARVSVYDEGIEDPVVVTSRRYVVQPTVSLYPFGYPSYYGYRHYGGHRVYPYTHRGGHHYRHGRYAYRPRVVHHHHHRGTGVVSRGYRARGSHRAVQAHPARSVSVQRGAAHGYSRRASVSVPQKPSGRGGNYPQNRRRHRR